MVFRDDTAWLRTRVSELEGELEAANREVAQLRDALPENARAVLARLAEQQRETTHRQEETLRDELARAGDELARIRAELTETREQLRVERAERPQPDTIALPPLAGTVPAQVYGYAVCGVIGLLVGLAVSHC